MTAIEQAAIADIIEHPDDDFYRLKFADYLEEHGEHERAEFIRVQCELAAFPEACPVCGRGGAGTTLDIVCEECERYDALGDRERFLLEAHGMGWAADMVESFGEKFGPPSGAWYGIDLPRTIRWTWTRGFVSSIACSWEDWRRAGPRAVRLQPITRVTLMDDFTNIDSRVPDELLSLMADQEFASMDNFRKAVCAAALAWAKAQALPEPATTE